VLQRDEFLDPSNPAFKNRILGELGDPKNQVNLNVSAKFKNVTLGYQFRWIDKMYLNTFEDFNSLNGLPPQNLDYAPIQKYPSVAYVDLRAAVDVTEGFNFYAGVDNLFNRKPPFGATGVGAGTGIYDNRGQYFYAGVVATF
jgi:outer membrane receptor protein involved in Fe transport